MKKTILIALSLIMVIALVACSQTDVGPPDEAGDLQLTLEELAQYNGKDGNPAYVAVDGIIYDLTDSSLWNGGEHNGFEAGNDLTDEIKNQSPHGVGNLEGFPVVGELVE
ncbi:MAG: cytochrome B5 [Tissierellia bacterium]|nr:cytochrome B5 [Tissierellia bacterium]